MIRYCVDCPDYQEGGFCKKKNKIVGALNDACVKEESEELMPIEIPEGMKRCKKCGRVLPLTEFFKHVGHSDGLQFYCKDCCRKAKKASVAKKCWK
jgi:hypothetical protein